MSTLIEPTLNGILSTVTTTDFEAWKLQIENKKAAIERMAERRRRELTPLERVGLPELERVNDTPPYIEIGGVRMARIDWNFVRSATKKIGGVDVPAFAVYRIYGQTNECNVVLKEDGSAAHMRLDWDSSRPWTASHTDDLLEFKSGRLTELRNAIIRGDKLTDDKPLAVQLNEAKKRDMRKAYIASAQMMACAIGLIVGGIAMSFLSQALGIAMAVIGCGGVFMGAVIPLITSATFGSEPTGRTNAGREWRERREQRTREEQIVVITHEFKGIIPESTKTKLRMITAAIEANAISRTHRSSHDLDKNNILLVEEAYNWSGSAVVIRNVDPLVVYKDWRGYYLIDAFDVSPLEDFLLKEAVDG